MVIVPKASYSLIGSSDIPKEAEFYADFSGIIYFMRTRKMAEL